MLESHYFDIEKFLTNLHDEVKSAKKNYENFFSQAENRLLNLEDVIDHVTSNGSIKIGTCMKLIEAVENKRKEIEIELSNDNSVDAYQHKFMDVEELHKEQKELQMKCEEQLKKCKILQSTWHEKKIPEMKGIQEKITQKYTNLKRLNKLYERKFNIVLASGPSNSYRLNFPIERKHHSSITFKLTNGVLELETINTDMKNKEAILKIAQSSSDFQGLLSLMNFARMMTIR